MAADARELPLLRVTSIKSYDDKSDDKSMPVTYITHIPSAYTCIYIYFFFLLGCCYFILLLFSVLEVALIFNDTVIHENIFNPIYILNYEK